MEENFDMKDKMLRNVIIDAIGTLDTDENGTLVLNIETKDNIQSYNDLENYFQQYDNLNKVKKAIAKKLGRYTPFTQFESDYIEKWFLDYNYSLDIINIALKKTTSKTNPNFEYLDKIISDWHDRNLKTVEDIEKFMAEYKTQTKNEKALKKQTNYNNYTKRKYDNLDNFYTNNA